VPSIERVADRFGAVAIAEQPRDGVCGVQRQRDVPEDALELRGGRGEEEAGEAGAVPA